MLFIYQFFNIQCVFSQHISIQISHVSVALQPLVLEATALGSAVLEGNDLLGTRVWSL